VATEADDVHDILQALEAVGADPRLSGGWGIDALVGDQTRPHRDVDLAVRAEAINAAVEALRTRGFEVTTDWLPVRIEVSRQERHVDLHPLHYRDDGSAWQSSLNETTFEYPAEAWVAGRIGGRTVVCLSPSMQRRFHSGYELSGKDRHDLATLDRLADVHQAEVSDHDDQ
jgi:lincosamide nucleotidyltransferase A/C/D/E